MSDEPTKPDSDDELVWVLHKHRWSAFFGGCMPPCGWRSSDVGGEPEQFEHARHIAEVIRSIPPAVTVPVDDPPTEAKPRLAESMRNEQP